MGCTQTVKKCIQLYKTLVCHPESQANEVNSFEGEASLLKK